MTTVSTTGLSDRSTAGPTTDDSTETASSPRPGSRRSLDPAPAASLAQLVRIELRKAVDTRALPATDLAIERSRSLRCACEPLINVASMLRSSGSVLRLTSIAVPRARARPIFSDMRGMSRKAAVIRW